MNLNFVPMDQSPQMNSNPGKYKTSLCKHFTTQKTCSFGNKCQFAHGKDELRSVNGMPMHNMNQQQSYQMEQTKGPNPQNYKIVKCKYWHQDNTCRYGSLCTFAHGDEELRTKSDNVMHNQFDPMSSDQMNMGMNQPMFPPGVMNPYMMGFDPNMMMGMPNMIDFPQDPKAMNDFFMNMQQPNVMAGGNQIPLSNMSNMNKGQFDKQDDSNN